jgi:hypothetical protein
MNRALTALCAAALILCAAASGAASPAPPSPNPTKTPVVKAPKLSKWQQRVMEEMHDSAPGDEYFGRMKMSYLGINNTFHDDAIRAGAYTTDSKLIGALNWADDALTTWARKYPNDPQLARSYFLGFEVYRKVWTQDGQQRAWRYANLVVEKWPNSYFGKILKKDLSVGFTEHYFALAVPCNQLAGATPTPAPTATPGGVPHVQVLPAPCIVVTPSPSPAPSISPAPSGSPAVTPSASPTPTASTTPKSTTSPSPTPSPTP